MKRGFRSNPIPAACLCLLSSLLVVAGSAAAAVYYVAPNGNDANPGSLEQPWATFLRAGQAMLPGDTTFIRGGVRAG